MTDKLAHYLGLWNLRDPELLAQSPRATTYAVQAGAARVVLKLFTPIGAEDEVGGACALQCFDGLGAVRLLNHDDEAYLMEYAGDEELAQWVWNGKDVAAAEIIAEVLNKLHRTTFAVPPPVLRTLPRRFRHLFEKAAQEEARGQESIYVRGARMARRLLATPQQECVLHGDIHHQNIRFHPTRGWLAFDPKGLYGERAYDMANTLVNPPHARALVVSEARMLRITQVMADATGVNVGRVRAFVFAYACLSASWFDLSDEFDDDVRQQMLTVARHAERSAEA